MFSSPIYVFEEKKFLQNIDNLCETYLKTAKKNNEKLVKDREKLFNKKIKDFGLAHSSENMYNDKNFKELCNFIGNISVDILSKQGFDLTNHRVDFTEMWVQEFSLNGGGHHDTHIHYNNHISGFYFLKCSEKTSYPVFHDPRPGKMMTQLLEKDSSKITQVSEKLNYKPIPGTFLFFNSYMPHEFVVDNGIEPFRFIHFNLQAISKEIVNEKLKHV